MLKINKNILRIIAIICAVAMLFTVLFSVILGIYGIS